MDFITEIKRWTIFLRSELDRLAAHRKMLELENPDALPLQDAIIEKALSDTGLLKSMAGIDRALQRGDLEPEAIRALNELQQACKEAAKKLPAWSTTIQ